MLDVSSSKRNDSAYFKELASTLDEHWRLVVRYILGYKCSESDTIPDNAIRKHCKENGLSYVGQFLKWKFEDKKWKPKPDDPGMKISDFYKEYKNYMEDEHKRRPLKQLKFKGELTGLYHMVHEKKTGDSGRMLYIENQQEMKDTLGVEELDLSTGN
jgi:phage/plasmid-associated DNA primase